MAKCSTGEPRIEDGDQVWKIDQPPLSVGSRLARRATRVDQSIATKSTFMPRRFSRSAVTSPIGWMVGTSAGLRITTLLPS